MKKILKNIFQQAKLITPDPIEKEKVLKNVADYLAKNPLPVRMEETNEFRDSIPYLYGYFIKERFALGFLIFFILTGATSVLANSSLPGDFLYPVKTHVNEKISSFSTIDTKANAVIHIEYATRRLTEARVLAIQGAINDDAEEMLAKSFDEHAKRVQALIVVMEKDGEMDEAEIIKEELEVRLKAHQEILIKISEKKSSDKLKKLEKINAVVNDFLKE